MSNYTYTGKIRIERTGTAIDVSVIATNNSVAKRIIENQYKVKHWVKQMSRS
jgi:S-adenosylhomocysteine hydrolase